MNTFYLDIGKEYTPNIGGRYEKHGPGSGEVFFRTVLQPAFEKYDSITVDLDSTETMSSSFHEEAWGGLVRIYGLESVQKKVRFIAVRRAYLTKRIEAWMKEAEEQRDG